MQPSEANLTSAAMVQSVVAFADALGTEATADSPATARPFLVRLQKSTSRVSERIEKLEELCRINVRWFSDSIAMSTPLDGTGKLERLLENLAFVQAAYALNGVFLRGAVTVGEHHHSTYIDYGPALSQAVKLERLSAGDTTRIMLSPSLQAHVRGFGPHELPLVEDLKDQAYFLDFIGSLDSVSKQVLREQIEAGNGAARLAGNEKVIAKLRWLASYFNWQTKTRKPIEGASVHEFSRPRPS